MEYHDISHYLSTLCIFPIKYYEFFGLMLSLFHNGPFDIYHSMICS